MMLDLTLEETRALWEMVVCTDPCGWAPQVEMERLRPFVMKKVDEYYDKQKAKAKAAALAKLTPEEKELLGLRE